MGFDADEINFIRSVVATVTVPAASSAALADLIQDDPIEKRTSLFYDERTRLIVWLDFPQCGENTLKEYLGMLELNLDIWVRNNKQEPGHDPTDSHLHSERIDTYPVNVAEDPITLIKQHEDNDSLRILLAWEVFVTINPRSRTGDQSITFVAMGLISQPDLKAEDDFMVPFSVASPNVLEAMHDHAAYLPLSRFERHLPARPNGITSCRLRYKGTEWIQAQAAIMPRLRYNKINTHQPTPATIASLDLQIIPFIEVEGYVQSIDMAIANGTVSNLMPGFLPMPCKSKDTITFLYRLESGFTVSTDPPSSPLTPTTNANIDTLSISMSITLNLSSHTTISISMAWTTNVDFSPALNPAYGAPAQPLQRTNRPTSLNFTPHHDPNKTDRTANVRAASTSLQNQITPPAERKSFSSTLTVSFLAPEKPCRIGKPFSWRVLVVNNGQNTAKLAIVPLPRIQRPGNPLQHFQKQHAPRASNANVPVLKHSRNQGSVAKAVVDEHNLFALHHQAGAGVTAVPVQTDIVSLTAELRIGPLAPGQCHETEIKFVVYKKGVLTIDAVRVVDLTREGEQGVGVINDLRELPDIIVE